MEISVEKQSGRGDLSSRMEVKYHGAGRDIEIARRHLEAFSRKIVYNEGVSTVRSIYFDDYRLSSCQDNLAGIGRRHKVRLRWYDRELPESLAFLEIKWRRNKVTGKHRFMVRTPGSLADLPISGIMHRVAPVLPREHAYHLHNYPDPILIVEYKREHFTSLVSNHRITLDYDLCFYLLRGKDRITYRHKQSMDRAFVIEGKCSPVESSELGSLLRPLRMRAVRFSKYVHGCDRLGLFNGTLADTY